MNQRKINRIAHRFQHFFCAAALTAWLRAHRVVGRQYAAQHHNFFLALLAAAVMGYQIQSISQLYSLYVQLESSPVTESRFRQLLAKPATARAMEALVRKLIRAGCDPALVARPQSKLERFASVALHDSTSMALDDGLEYVYPNRFRAIYRAGISLHMTFDVRAGLPIHLQFSSMCSHESNHTPDLTCLSHDTLILTDAGFQRLSYMLDIDRSGSSFIMRGSAQINPRVQWLFVAGVPIDVPDDGSLKLKDVLKTHHGHTIEAGVFWPHRKGKPQLRVVVAWQHEKRKRFKKKQKLRAVILLTNLKREEHSAGDVLEHYRCRWQIELVFKQLKSHCNFRSYNTSSKATIDTLLWSSIGGWTIKQMVLTQVPDITGDARHMSGLKAMQGCPMLWWDFFKACSDGKSLRKPLRKIIDYMGRFCRRAHTKRDQEDKFLPAFFEPYMASSDAA